MAREWTEIVAQIEAHYPTAAGGTGQDSRLQLNLARFASSFFKDMERKRRWSLAYIATPFTTTAALATYPIPANITAIRHLYYLLPSGGVPVELELYDPGELRLAFGEGVNSQQGSPRAFAILGTNVQLFPIPDDNAGANYTLVIEGYQTLKPIVETTGSTAALGPTLTVPSNLYLTDRGIANAGSYLSVRGAGNAGPSGVADTLFTNWTAFVGTTQLTMATAASANTTVVQTFFNSWNWLIDAFDLVVLFGVLREVAAYEKENFVVWEKRLEGALDEMAQYDADRQKTLMQMGTAVTAQRLGQLARLDARGRWGIGGLGGVWF